MRILPLLFLLFPGMALAQEKTAVSRRKMVTDQLVPRGIHHPGVLRAMGTVERHRFVPKSVREKAYGDHPLPIGHGQTISQPFMVAYMTQRLDVDAGDVVLEIGTGSGYQAAVLAELVKRVYTIEIVAPLAERARKALVDAGYDNIVVRHGDGYRGWPEHAPFDAIIVTAAPEKIPQPLIDQLKPGGKLVVPLGPGDGVQYLTVLEKRKDGTLKKRKVMPVRFVPFTGEAEKNRNPK